MRLQSPEGATHEFYTNPESKYTARDCYFAMPESLLHVHEWQDSNAPFAWNGERNVYSAAFGFYAAGSGTTNDLAGFTKFVQSEQGSVNEPSLLLDPKFWKLMPNSPGAGASAGGADLGADTTKIALPSP